MPTASLLRVDNLYMRFGGLVAVDNVSFSIKKGQIFSIIGPNGAGKTTIFNCISGFYAPTSGNITLNTKAIEGLPSHQIAKQGLKRTFQNIRLFKEMTVLENLLIAVEAEMKASFFASLLRLKSYRDIEKQAFSRAKDWLEYTGLTAFANKKAGDLSYGQQRHLEIARCMITEPRLLLLDEPAAGLNPQETDALINLISWIKDNYGTSVLLIEHDMRLIMRISEQILVVEYGEPIALGKPEEIQKDPKVIKAYLGEE